jgi:hypothetical protein
MLKRQRLLTTPTRMAAGVKNELPSTILILPFEFLIYINFCSCGVTQNQSCVTGTQV